MMNPYSRGLLAGLIATVALSALMILKMVLGLLPQFNAVAMLAGIGHGYLGLPATPAVGWIGHLVLGTVVWGLLFAGLDTVLPGPTMVVKGLVFGLLAWLAMMVIFMPLAGAGLFALDLGLPVTVATLVLHLIYGAVLGGVYGQSRPPQMAREAYHRS
jgi:hypothetical protein